MRENLDLNAFKALSDRQRSFLLDLITDPETGTRHFQIESERAMQFWFEELIVAGWVNSVPSSTRNGMSSFEIPMSLWPVIAEAKAAG